MKTVPPTTVAGIERYLGSGLVNGIGPVLAKKLVGKFGAEVLTVIETRTTEMQVVKMTVGAGQQLSPENGSQSANCRTMDRPW
jgi:hypothetical protein